MFYAAIDLGPSYRPPATGFCFFDFCFDKTLNVPQPDKKPPPPGSQEVDGAPSGRSNWSAEFSLICVALFWGLNIPVMKYATGEMDIYLFNALRLALSAITLGVCVRWQGRPMIDRSPGALPLRKQITTIVLISLLTGFFYQLLFLLGIAGTSAGNTALIMSTVPMWTALLALLLLNERLSRIAWTGLTIALIGTLVVTLSKPAATDRTNTLTGNLIVSAAAFSWALGAVWSRPVLKSISPVVLAFYSIAATLPLHFLVARQTFGNTARVLADPWLVAVIVYSGICSTGLAYAMWNYGVQQLGAAHAAAFQNLVPLIAMTFGWLLLGEVPFAMQLIGGAMIIAGLVVMRRRGAANLPTAEGDGD